MFKKFVVLLACLGLVAQLTACTSKDAKEDGEEISADAVAEVDGAEVEKVEGGENLDIAAEDNAAMTGDTLPEDALGESATTSTEAPPPMEENVMEAAPAPDVAAAPPAEPPPIDDSLGANSSLPADSLGEIPSMDTSSSSVVENVPAQVEKPSHSSSSSMSSMSSDEPKPAPAPYRKVETTPWKEGGKTLNTVYLAREGDSWKSVANMIYGSDKSSELKKSNPAIKGRKLKMGDKVYYNSPHRPDDSEKVLNYYEDNGIAPEIYIAKPGDTVKKAAKEVLGSEQGWKELFATNTFESKGALDEGTQIKYWKSAPPAPKNEMAAAAPVMPPAPPAEMAPPPPPADMPPPPPPDMAAAPPPPPPPAEMAPPPPPPDMAAAPPPPPPPPMDMAPPPPPKPPGHTEGATMEEDQMTTLAAGAVVAVGMALFLIMRRKRKRELEQAIQDTQVG